MYNLTCDNVEDDDGEDAYSSKPKAEAGVPKSASEERKEIMEEQKESAVAKAQGVCRSMLLSLRICVQSHM